VLFRIAGVLMSRFEKVSGTRPSGVFFIRELQSRAPTPLTRKMTSLDYNLAQGRPMSQPGTFHGVGAAAPQARGRLVGRRDVLDGSVHPRIVSGLRLRISCLVKKKKSPDVFAPGQDLH